MEPGDRRFESFRLDQHDSSSTAQDAALSRQKHGFKSHIVYQMRSGEEESHLAHNQEVAWFESRLRYQASRCNRFCTPPCQGGGNGFKSRRDRQDVCRSGLTATLGKRVGRNAPWVRIPQHPPGDVAEWPKALVSKTSVPTSVVPWVRIPPSPPGRAAIGVAHRLENGWAFAEVLQVRILSLPPGVVDYRKVS